MDRVRKFLVRQGKVREIKESRFIVREARIRYVRVTLKKRILELSAQTFG